jgi:hypothetical protein
MGTGKSFQKGSYPGSMSALDGDPDGVLSTDRLFPKLVKSDMLWILERSVAGQPLPLTLSHMTCGDIANEIGRNLIKSKVCTIKLCEGNVQLHRTLLQRMLSVMGEQVEEEEEEDKWEGPAKETLPCNSGLQRRLEKAMLGERARRIMVELVKELDTTIGNGSVQDVVELQEMTVTRNLELFKWVSEKEAPWTFLTLNKEARGRVRGLLQHFEDEHVLIKVEDEYQRSHAFRTALMRWVLFALWTQAPPEDKSEDLEWKLKNSSGVLLDYPEPLVPGDMLSRRITLKLKHYGIYIGGVFGHHFVVDFDTDSRVRETAEVYLRTMKEFAFTQIVHVRRFHKLRPVDLIPRRITLALLQRLSGAQTRYQMSKRNCETFASLLRMGRLYCQQCTLNPMTTKHHRLRKPTRSDMYINPGKKTTFSVSGTYCEDVDCENCRVAPVENMLVFGRIQGNTVFPSLKDVLSSRYAYSTRTYREAVGLLMSTAAGSILEKALKIQL